MNIIKFSVKNTVDSYYNWDSDKTNPKLWYQYKFKYKLTIFGYNLGKYELIKKKE